MSAALNDTDHLSSSDVARISPRALPGSLVKHHDLVRWLVDQGGFLHPDIVIAYLLGKGYHAVVGPGRFVAKDTVIASCPMAATLCVLNALDIAPFACHGTRFPRAFLDKFCTKPETLQAFFLMEQHLLGETSFWAKYLATLPSVEDIEDLQFKSEQDRIWIQGTNLEAAIDLQLQTWYENYEDGIETLKQCNWQSAHAGRLTW